MSAYSNCSLFVEKSNRVNLYNLLPDPPLCDPQFSHDIASLRMEPPFDEQFQSTQQDGIVISTNEVATAKVYFWGRQISTFV